MAKQLSIVMKIITYAILLQLSYVCSQSADELGSGGALFNASYTTTLATSEPVFAPSEMTYGDNICENYISGGDCVVTLDPFPLILTNLSRAEDQSAGLQTVQTIIGGLHAFNTPQHCISVAVPLLCRYSFPTCDPAYREPTYQPICQRDCTIVRDFLCREPWQAMVALLSVLDFDYLDTPDCDPLDDTEAGSSPMCISTINKDFIPLPLLTGNCTSGRGRGYQGTVSITESGRTCQAWSDSYPHQHLLAYENYTELSGGHNFCRNPGERGERPWCFTTDREQRWEYCDITECDPGPTCVPYLDGACRLFGTIGMDWVYLDTSSISNQQELDGHVAEVLMHVDTSAYSDGCKAILSEYTCISNYPSCDLSHSAPRPIQPCQSFCNRVNEVCGADIRGLKSFTDLLNDVTLIFNCPELPQANGGEAPECYEQTLAAPQRLNTTTDCYNLSDLGISYRGSVAVTRSGQPCQMWLDQSPHPHPITPLNRPELEGHNHCRNPDGRGLSPWCYTTDENTRWEYCDIAICAVAEKQAGQSLPLFAYVLIGVGSLLVLLIILSSILIICCCICSRASSKAVNFEETCSNTYQGVRVDNKIKLVDVKDKADITDNPLYAMNPLTQQPVVDYDGVKLPEFPRDKLFYIKDLGQGHFGVVVQAEAVGLEAGKEKSSVAIKVMKEGASSQTRKEFFREATLMNTFDHPNILRLLGVCISQEPFCMIFEFMELGDLNNYLRQSSYGNRGSNPSLNRSGHLASGRTTLSTQQLVCVAIDVAAGLDYLAQNHYVHRDLATRNCLVSRNLQVKISDFGLSQDIYTTDYFRMGDMELLPIRWMPPEAILYAKFTTQSDVWSFGIVLWEIFSFGIQPYFSMTNEEVVQHVRNGNVMNCPEGCPQEIYDLMVDCWAMDPTARPTAGAIHTGLQRWSPDLSATLQSHTAEKPAEYQNVGTVLEYANKDSILCAVPSDNGDVATGGGQLEMSATEDEVGAEKEHTTTTEC